MNYNNASYGNKTYSPSNVNTNLNNLTRPTNSAPSQGNQFYNQRPTSSNGNRGPIIMKNAEKSTIPQVLLFIYIMRVKLLTNIQYSTDYCRVKSTTDCMVLRCYTDPYQQRT